LFQFPKPLKRGDTIAVTTPPSGVEVHFHEIIKKAVQNIEMMGFKIIVGEAVWTQKKARSDTKEKRAKEFMHFILDDNVDVIMPPWGGSFLMEILPLLDWEKLKNTKPKWIMGYSDISTLLFAYTLNTLHASAHDTNFFELSFDKVDATTAKWPDVLGLHEGQSIKQVSSENYQSSWDNVLKNPGIGFDLDSPTKWKTFGEKSLSFSGRLIGGCLNTISIIAGTKYTPFEHFRLNAEEGLVWYLEWTGLNARQVRRELWKLDELGWFENTNGVIIGRPSNSSPLKDFTYVDAIQETFEPLNIPLIYDADIGHVPPLITLTNGAYAEVRLCGAVVGGRLQSIGKDKIEDDFKMLNYLWLDDKSPILNQIPNSFKSAVILLHPFIQMPEGWTEIQKGKNPYKHIYPSDEEMLNLAHPVSWGTILQKSGLVSLEELAIALKTSIGALKRKYSRDDLAEKLNSSLNADLYYPPEDYTPVFLIKDLLKVLSSKGAVTLYFSEPIGDTSGSLQINNITPLDICKLSGPELIMTDENMDYAFMSVYDSFITLFLAKDENLQEIVELMNWETIICDNQTYISWYFSIRSI